MSKTVATDLSPGNSVFPLRILLRFLPLKLLTVLQIKPTCTLLFYEKGVKEFSQSDDGVPYNAFASEHDPLDRIWALVDSNQKLHEPASDFPDDPVFVIQASSPRPMCHEWVRGVSTPDVLYENMALS